MGQLNERKAIDGKGYLSLKFNFNYRRCLIIGDAMVLEKLFKKIKTEEAEKGEEFVEIDAAALKEERGVNVRIETLEDYVDTDRIQGLVREGNVVFLRIKKLRQKDISELKRAVDKLRKTCIAMNGDIVGVDEDFLIITPQFAHIYRGKAG